LWPYLLFVALLLNAVIIVWWIGPWHSGERSARPHPTVWDHTSKAVTAETVEKKKPGTQVPKKLLPPSKIMNELPKRPAVEKTKESLAPVRGKTPAPKNTPAAMPVSPELRAPAKTKVVPEGRIVKLNDLPPEIKSSLPDLKMSVHFYSADKQARFAIINDRTLHEGEPLSEGLRVVEINPYGTVLHYRGHRFLISVN
jgi:general secretion pathway protein B